MPAIYGTRVLATRRERVLASFLVTLVPCSARSAVVVAALMPFAGPVATAGAFAVIVAVTLGAGIAANALLPGRQSLLILELAPLRRPLVRQVGAKAWARFRAFVRTAAPVMLAGSVVLGFLYEAGILWPVSAVSTRSSSAGWGCRRSRVSPSSSPPAQGAGGSSSLLVLAVATFGAGAASLGVFMSRGSSSCTRS